MSALGIAILAFTVMSCDELFRFAGQLALTSETRLRRVCVAHASAMVLLLSVSAAVAAFLSPISVRWVGLGALALFGLALHALQDRRAPREQYTRGVLSTFSMTVIHGGAVLVTWAALLRAHGVAHGVVMAVAYALMEVAFIFLARALRHRTGLVAWGRRHANALTSFADLVLGVLVLWDCHTF